MPRSCAHRTASRPGCATSPSSFHGFYRDCRVITDDAALTQARLWLTEACRIGLADALGILGVSAPEVMERLDDGRRRRGSRVSATRRAPFDQTLVPPGLLDVDLDDARGPVRHAAVRLRRGPPPAPAAASSRPQFGADNVAYAGKAFLCLAMARLVAEEGLKLDVATGGELAVALRAGISRRRGWSSTATTRATRRSRPRATQASVSWSRTRSRSSSGSSGLGFRGEVFVRVTPGVEAHTHEYIETGTERSKFGFSVAKGDALAAVRHVVDVAGLTLRRDPLPHRVAGVPARLVREGGGGRRRVRRRVRAGDGSTRCRRSTSAAGSARGTSRRTRSCRSAEYARVLHDAVGRPDGHGRAGSGDRGHGRHHRLPGRHDQGDPGTSRPYVAVDGGMSDNPRPVLYGAGYEAYLPGPDRRSPGRSSRRSRASTASRVT